MKWFLPCVLDRSIADHDRNVGRERQALCGRRPSGSMNVPAETEVRVVRKKVLFSERHFQLLDQPTLLYSGTTRMPVYRSDVQSQLHQIRLGRRSFLLGTS